MDDRSALIVIDMQRGFLDPGSAQYIDGAAASVPACARLIENCRERGIPVFFVIREYRADGSDVEHTRFKSWYEGGKAISRVCDSVIGMDMPEEFGVCDKDYVLIKPRYSAFFQTGLDMMLRRLRRDTVLLTGTTTPNCIRTSCYDGISLEYNVAVFSDCTSSINDEVQRMNLEDMQRVGAQIISSEDFISGKEKIFDSIGYVHDMVKKGI